MRDWLNQCLITVLLHLHIIICKDVSQTIPSSFDGDGYRLCNPLGISPQSETWFEPVLQHHSVYHLIHVIHKNQWGLVLIGVIYQLHHVEICTSRYLINNWRLSSRVTPLTMNNQLFILQKNFHHLMQGRRHNSNHMDGSPSQKKVVAGVDV